MYGVVEDCKPRKEGYTEWSGADKGMHYTGWSGAGIQGVQVLSYKARQGRMIRKLSAYLLIDNNFSSASAVY
jgi:hypothetical protein